MEDQIRNARLSFTCDQNWEGMKPDGEGRFCSGCQKKVYDLRDKNAAYFIKIMQETTIVFVDVLVEIRWLNLYPIN